MGNRVVVALRASISCMWVGFDPAAVGWSAGLQVPLIILTALEAVSATHVVVFFSIAYATLPIISFSMHLYSVELYSTRSRATGPGFGSACLRAGSGIGGSRRMDR